MRRIRATVGLVGVAAVALATGATLLPGAVPALDLVGRLGNDYLVLVPLGLGSAAVVLGALGARSIRGVKQATPPSPEGLPTAESPGADFDRLVEGGLLAAPAAIRARDRLHGRLREAALRTVIRTAGCTRAEARRRLETGTWTDDPEAAAFLREEPGRRRSRVGLLVDALVAREIPVQRRARRTALAIDRVGREGPA